MKILYAGGIFTATLLLLGVSCVPVENIEDVTNHQEENIVPIISLSTKDQPLTKSISPETNAPYNAIIIDEVNTEDGGWLVVRISNNGELGKLIGNQYVAPGTQTNIPVYISMRNINETELGQVEEMTAVLHRDEGIKEQFEIDTVDTPYEIAPNIVVKSSFKIL